MSPNRACGSCLITSHCSRLGGGMQCTGTIVRYGFRPKHHGGTSAATCLENRMIMMYARLSGNSVLEIMGKRICWSGPAVLKLLISGFSWREDVCWICRHHQCFSWTQVAITNNSFGSRKEESQISRTAKRVDRLRTSRPFRIAHFQFYVIYSRLREAL